MKCPYCGCEKNEVIDSRQRPDGTIGRRRMCKNCKSRFSTVERLYKNPDGSIEKPQKTVVLATGEDQKFDFVLMVRAKKRG